MTLFRLQLRNGSCLLTGFVRILNARAVTEWGDPLRLC
jgi:hypothetical protein